MTDSVLFTIFFPLLLVIATILGFWIAWRFYKKKKRAWSTTGIEGGTIGLYSLLLSFTLVSSGSGQKERNTLVTAVTDAAAQYNRMLEFSDSNVRGVSRRYLRECLYQHLNFFDDKLADEEAMSLVISKLNADLWKRLKEIGNESEGNEAEVKSLLPLFHQFNSSSYRLLYSYQEQTPDIVMILLIVSSLFIAVLVGFMNGIKERRHYLLPLIFLLLVSLTIEAIRDLNNPRDGYVKPQYDRIRRLVSFIDNKT